MLPPESQTIEYKSEYVADIKKEITAFANTTGGTLYVGVNDDGSIVGVERPDLCMQQLSNAIRDGIRPDVTMFTRLETVSLEGCTVLRVTVTTATNRPYYLSDKGLRPSGVYLRQGSTSAPASEEAIRSMIRQTGGDAFEDNRSLLQELTFHSFQQEMQLRNLECGSAQMRTLGLIANDGLYTNLALLVSDQCQHSIKFAVFQGDDKLVFKDRKEFTGSLFAQLEQAYQAIDFCNQTKAHFEGLLRSDERDYPPDAIREALLNAIVHRDYGFSGSISINLYANRIEFISLGGLVPGFSLDAALMGASQPRNPKLAALFYRMQLIEAFGTGLGKIVNSYAGQMVQPSFEPVDGAFRVTLPNLHPSPSASASIRTTISAKLDVVPTHSLSPLSASVQKAFLLFEQGNVLARAELENALGIKTSRAIAILNELLVRGKIVKVGSGKNTRYQIK